MDEHAEPNPARQAAEDVNQLLNRPGLRKLARLALRVTNELGTVAPLGSHGPRPSGRPRST
jgi:hypothetical protein